MRRTKEELINTVHSHLLQFESSDVISLLLSIVSNRRAFTITLLYVDLESLRLDGFVSIQARIVISKRNGRYVILSLISGNRQYVINHVAFNTICRQFGFIRYLRIILVKVFGECNVWLFNQFQITYASHNNTKGNGFASLHFRVINRS